MVLLTGGAGYIGSHTAVELLEAGEEIVIVDDFSNSNEKSLDAIRKITGKDFKFYEIDVCDKEKFRKVFEENNITEIIAFAGYKAVGESVVKPLKYYSNNLIGILVTLELMKEYNVTKIIFSSSATVYGDPEDESKEVTEDNNLSFTNPYGGTKYMIEYILKDISKADPKFTVEILRYFNPVGAHKSGLIGENPDGKPNNLMPYILKVAVGELDHLNVFGNDYDTEDGTGVRDFIHVVDLAKGHIAALNHMRKHEGKTHIFNLGTGKGTSVLEMVKAFEKATGLKVKYDMAERRPGDIAKIYTNVEKAKKELEWTADLGIEDMCKSVYNFYKVTHKGDKK